jgi:hypothetical protein
MRITIIPVDGAVYIDGTSYSKLDLSTCDIPSNIHALQWHDTYGELEFKRSFVDGQIVHPVNELLTELPIWANAAVTVWNQAKLDFEEAQRIAAEEAQRIAAEEAAALANASPQTVQTP